MNKLEEIKLEEIIKRIKLSGNRILIKSLVSSMIFANTLFISCDKPTAPSENIPPQTEIIKGPEGTINTDNVTFEWKGSDEDGYVVNYKYNLHPTYPDYVTTKDKTKTFENLFNDSYTFKVAAQDNDREWDPKEASRIFTVDVEEPAVELPDLVPVDVWTDPNPPVGKQPFTIYWKIKNQGDAPANSFKTQFLWGTGGSDGYTKWNMSLSPGQTHIESATFPGTYHGIYFPYLEEGPHKTSINVDRGNVVIESNEDNNYLEKIIEWVAPTQTDTLITDTTDLQGMILFYDTFTGNQDTVIVTNKYDQPVSDIEVTFRNDEEFKVFLTNDPNQDYLPTLLIRPHNSVQIIQVGTDQDPYVQVIDDDENMKAVYKWQSKDKIAWTEHTYWKTVDFSEVVEMQERLYVMNSIMLKIVGLFPIKMPFVFNELFDILEQQHNEFIKSDQPKRWDVYKYAGNYFNPNSINMTWVPSNVPEITIDDLVVDEDDITFYWTADDKEMYEDIPQYLFTAKDITVLLGPTLGSDLEEYYKIYDNTNQTTYKSYTKVTESPAQESNLPPGDYTLDMIVVDEVGNGDISERIPFVISTEQALDSLVIQPGPEEGKDAYVDTSYFEGDTIDYSDINYGQIETLWMEIMEFTDCPPYAQYCNDYSITRSYIQFDLSPVPPNANVTSALLSLYGLSYRGQIAQAIEIRKVLDSWDESTITWNNQPRFSNDIEATIGPFINLVLQWNTWDITNLVNEWIKSQSTNNGLALKIQSEIGLQIFSAWSSDHTEDPTLRPKLVIEYTD